MLIQLDDIKPSPYNPKQPLTKKQFAALKKNVEQFGFQRDLLVCRDFNTGEGYICLDGHTALELLRELGRNQVECKVVENVTDRKTLTRFITGYAISKKPLINEMFKELGNELEDVFGKSGTFFDEVSKINYSDSESRESQAMNQTQYFLTLPADCVKKLKGFVRTKAYNQDKYKAICGRIEKADEEHFLECLFSSLFGE